METILFNHKVYLGTVPKFRDPHGKFLILPWPPAPLLVNFPKFYLVINYNGSPKCASYPLRWTICNCNMSSIIFIPVTHPTSIKIFSTNQFQATWEALFWHNKDISFINLYVSPGPKATGNRRQTNQALCSSYLLY